MATLITPAQTDWLTGFLARTRQQAQPGTAVDTAEPILNPLPADQGTGGAPDPGQEGAEGAGAGIPGVNPHLAEIEKRRAERDAEQDEYGIEKPAISWTEKLIDDVAPPEIVNDPETPWFETMGRALAVAPAAVAGHVLDNIWQADTRGHAKLTLPILSELGEGEEQARYRREREKYEDELRREAAEKAAEVRNSDSAKDQPPGPWAENGSCPAPDQDGEDTRPPGPWADDDAAPAPEAAAAPAEAPAEDRPPGPWADNDATAVPESATAPESPADAPQPDGSACTDTE